MQLTDTNTVASAFVRSPRARGEASEAPPAAEHPVPSIVSVTPAVLGPFVRTTALKRGRSTEKASDQVPVACTAVTMMGSGITCVGPWGLPPLGILIVIDVVEKMVVLSCWVRMTRTVLEEK